MMLIHDLQDRRVDPYSAILNRYHELTKHRGEIRSPTREEYARLFKFGIRHSQAIGDWMEAEEVRSRKLASVMQDMEREIHFVEWARLLRLAGLEGSTAADITEKVLDQAINGESVGVRDNAVRYLESLENDIWLIRQTKVDQSRLWSVRSRLTRNTAELERAAQLQEKKRQILIDGFGAQGEALAARNARLEELAPLPPSPLEGTCQICRTNRGARYQYRYVRYTGEYYYKVLGSFEVFLCRRCKWMRLQPRMLTAACVCVVCIPIGGLLISNGFFSDRGWLGLILTLLIIVVFMVSLLKCAAYYLDMLHSIIELGFPKHIGVPVMVQDEKGHELPG